MDRPTPEPDPSTDAAENVRTHGVGGGTVVLSALPDRAVLISATPRPGYAARTWEHPGGWLRVESTAADRSSTLIATWHDGPTRVETHENQPRGGPPAARDLRHTPCPVGSSWLPAGRRRHSGQPARPGV
ncbi:hypothetical protein [Saccharopolyspora hordei]|uniref:Uncharacterized protein n=1 Tax=Saccharopolyspora hordei TaxID=1838 RepID=A0A853ADW4_9PSEU|nr:hypothetical protein [Saccharopolyspora hordei]NYI82692.1 hypothetical protein [Saccharopolyspora hordei]